MVAGPPRGDPARRAGGEPVVAPVLSSLRGAGGHRDPRRGHGWVDDEVVQAYTRLHELGRVHSAEAWTPEGDLVGGLYGVAVGGLFAGESMFSHRTDASKVALVELVERLRTGGTTLLDVQWTTDHLESLGAVDVPRAGYVAMAAEAVADHRLLLTRAAAPV